MPGTSNDKYVTKRYVYEQNRLVKTITDRDGTPHSELKFSYDNLGKLVSGQLFFYANGTTLPPWIYEYDNKNRIIKINTPLVSGIYYSLYEYDSLDNVVKYSAYDNVTNQLAFYVRYENDSRGNTISRESFVNNNGTIDYIGKYLFTYDTKRNPYNTDELRIATSYENCYSSGGKAEHNFLYEMIPQGQVVASAPYTYTYYKNGLPKARWHSFVANTDTLYYYYK